MVSYLNQCHGIVTVSCEEKCFYIDIDIDILFALHKSNSKYNK